jgi:GNAT superfamily N-acetyltransferase
LCIGIIIREATPSDTEVIADYNCRLAFETEARRLDVELVRQGVGALLQDPAKGIYYVAEIPANGEPPMVAGQLLITYEWSDWRNGNFWWIQSVYVEKTFRGKGVFTALFEHVSALAAGKKDVCGLRLYMEAENGTARRAYERIGFLRTSYEVFEMDFVKDPHHRRPSKAQSQQSVSCK